MKRITRPLLLSILLGVFFLSGVSRGGEAWSRFRGPNGSGVTESADLPTEFGPEKNLIWKTPLPSGHSSPVLTGNRIFLTAVEAEKLLTLCLDSKSGKILWRREAPRDRHDELDSRNNPASPTPVTDGKNLYVFFPEFGLLSYDLEGGERWRVPLGPFRNLYGMGASPILADDKVILVCDQNRGSFVIALGQKDGKLHWKTDRPEAKSGHSTPILYEPRGGPRQIIVPGSFLLTAYSVADGQKLWWVRGLSFEMKSTPVMANGLVYINGYGSPMNQPGSQVKIDGFKEVLSSHDSNADGRISAEEAPDQRTKSFFPALDLDGNNLLDEEEWSYYRAAMSTTNGMLAIRTGGRGDMTEASTVWQYHKSVPQLPSPLLYENVLYMVNDGGIVTSFKPHNGEVIAQGRLTGAIDHFYASPVASDQKIFMPSETGKVAVLKSGGALDVLAVNDLEENIYATPAIAGNRLYIRTAAALYCFGPTDAK